MRRGLRFRPNVSRAAAALSLAAIVALAFACGDDDGGESAEPSPAREEAAPGPPATDRPHALAPPPGQLRAVPPYAIRQRGVGPFELGASLEEILGTLPHGPRVELLQIRDVLDYSLVRLEDDALVVGVRHFEGVTFVAVLDEDIAATKDGLGVGADPEVLAEATKGALEAPGRVRDPRIRGYDALQKVQFVVEDGSAIAVIVGGGRSEQTAQSEQTGSGAEKADGPSRGDAGAAGAHARAVPGADAQGAPGNAEDAGGAGAPAEREEDDPRPCERVEALREVSGADVAEAAGLEGEAIGSEVGCFAGAGERLLAAGDDSVVALEWAGEGLEPVAELSAPGLAYAAPLDVAGEGRQLAAIATMRRDGGEVVAELSLARLAAGGLEVVDRFPAYRITERWARWIGADLADLEILLTARASAGAVEVGGIFLHRDRDRIRHIAPVKAKNWAPDHAAREEGAAALGDREAGADGGIAPGGEGDDPGEPGGVRGPEAGGEGESAPQRGGQSEPEGDEASSPAQGAGGGPRSGGDAPRSE